MTTLSRRDVLKLGGAAAGVGALAGTVGSLLPGATAGASPAPSAARPRAGRPRLDGDIGASNVVWTPGQALPSFAEPTHLDVVDLTTADGDTQTLLTTLQGLVNRVQPRIYLLLQGDGTDQTWLDTIGVPYTVHSDPMSLVARYRHEIAGTLIWDLNVLDTLNVATSMASLVGGVVVSPALATTLEAAPYHLPVLHDFRGQFTDKLAAYNWALDELWPHLDHRLLTAVSPTQAVTTPGVTWTTIAEVTQHVHDSSNEGTYTFDLSGQLGGNGVYVKFSDAYTNEGWGPSVDQVTVTADGTTIASFQPTTAGETPYVYDLDSSSVAGGGWRFADGTSYFVYVFNPPAGTTTLTLTVHMWNQYEIQATDTAPEETVGFPNLRDYIIATKALVFWLDPQVTDEAALFATILDKTAPDTPYLGWFVDGHEQPGVTLCAQHGAVVLAADFFNNGSVHGGVRAPIRPRQPRASVPALANKIYVALVLVEGDNLQYDQHELRLRWDDPARGQVPLNWTIDPLLVDAGPDMWSYFQRTQTANDFLVAGPSGAGYTYPDEWPTADINSYTQRTGRYLARTGIDTIYVLNRNADSDLPALSAGTARSYTANVPNLLGVFYNWESTGGTATSASLPVVTVIGCNAVSDMQNALDSVAAGWDGTSPAFVALGVETWNLGPTDCAPFVQGLGSQYEVVRADAFFSLLRRSMS